MIPNVFQPNVSVTAPVGGSVMLECHTTADPVVVTVHTAGRDEEHADEEVLQNNSL